MAKGQSQNTSAKRAHSESLALIGGRYGDLALTLMFTVLTFVFIFLPYFADTLLRSVIGLFFILLVPGYSSLAALLPRKEDLTIVERIGISIGMSVVIVILTGFVLNFTDFGIRIVPLATFLGLFVLVTAVIACFRRRSLAPAELSMISMHKFSDLQKKLHVNPQFSANTLLTASLILLIVIASSLLTYLVFLPPQKGGFTEFYILGTGNRTDHYPTELTPGQAQILAVNISNHEGKDSTYHLVVSLNGTNNRTELYNNQITVENDKSWQESLSLKPNYVGTNLREEFLLYLDSNSTTPYRELHLWVNVTK
jgi:uncharacterized membrane protein